MFPPLSASPTVPERKMAGEEHPVGPPVFLIGQLASRILTMSEPQAP